MKILIVSQYFWPEDFRINDLALSLVEKGHQVTVITGNPNYPKGQFNVGYGFKYSNETYKEIRIYRVPIVPRGNNGFMLLMNYISFVFFGSLFTFFHKIRYDQVFAVNYSPITAVIPGIVYCLKNKKKISIWVQDLWPESVVAAGSYKSTFIKNLVEQLVIHIYRNSNLIFVANKGFVKSIREKGVLNDKIKYMPNWAEELYELNIDNDFKCLNDSLPESFTVMFAGNLGDAQDLEAIIEAAKLTRNNDKIQWVILGEGRKKGLLTKLVEDNDLHKTVKLLGRFPKESMPSFFAQADVMLVSLRDEYIYSLYVPGKVQAYMAAGKPILTMMDGAGSDVVLEADCGLTAPAGDFVQLASNVLKYSNFSADIKEKHRKNSLKYYKENYAKDKIIEYFINEIGKS